MAGRFGVGDLPRPPEGVELGPLEADEEERLFELFSGVVARGEGYPQLPPLTHEAFEAAWTTPARLVVAARSEGVLVGAYYLKPNGPGRGAHIANAGYLVDPPHRRQGIGRALVADSILQAGRLGFDAMQFNFVFASNPARPLYEELGFVAVGRIPGGVASFGGDGAEDAVIYWRSLSS